MLFKDEDLIGIEMSDLDFYLCPFAAAPGLYVQNNKTESDP